MLFELDFDGVDFGNTSTDYTGLRGYIAREELGAFDYFTKKFGGGVSGRPLKAASLLLSSLAADYVRSGKPDQEFHIWRTGGIEGAEDIRKSERAGISMNLWLTGFFGNFARYGHDIYRKLYEELAEEDVHLV